MKVFLVVAAAALLAAVEGAPDSDTSKNITFIISGSKIPTQDDYSAVDAFVKVYSKAGNGEEERLGTTDTIRDEENPEWENAFWVEWKKGSGQKLHFVVKDHDVLDTDDDVGEATLDLDEFVAKNQTATVPLSGGGELTVKGTHPVKFQLFARNVPHKDRLHPTLSQSGVRVGSEAHSDPYVKIYWRTGKEGADHYIAQSTVIDNEENPTWPETFEFSSYKKGTNQYLYFKVKDQDTLSKNERIGDLLVEADPYVAGAKRHEAKLENSNGRATLTIVPI